MLKEALEYLFNRGVEHADPKFLECARFPRRVWLKSGEPGAALEMLSVPPMARTDRLEDLESFTRLVEGFLDGGPEVYVDTSTDDAIVAVLDQESRRDRAMMNLRPSSLHVAAEEAAKGTLDFDVAGAARFLRLQLAAPPELAPALARIDFSRKATATAGVGHGRESLGKAVEAEGLQAEKIPQSFKTRAPLYLNPGCRQHVNLTFQILLNMQSERIEFGIRQDELIEAKNVVADLIETELRVRLPGVNIYRGRP